MPNKLKNISTVADNNNAAPPLGFPENQAPSTVNNAARQLMATVREWYQDAEWVELGDTVTMIAGQVVTLNGDRSAFYHAPQACRIDGTEGTISAVGLVSGNTTLTIEGLTVPGTITTLEIGIHYATGRRLVNGTTKVELPTANGPVVVTGGLAVSGAISTNAAFVNLNAATTLARNTGYYADTSGGAFTATLPNSGLLEGDRISIIDVVGSFVASNLTLNRNGALINGLAENLLIDINYFTCDLRYRAATNDWRIT